jgi:hypothetical protein
MISLKNVHFEKGTLLEYNNIAFLDRVRPTRPVAMPAMAEMPLTDYSMPNRTGPLELEEPTEPAPTWSSDEVFESIPAGETLPSIDSSNQ